MAACSSVGTSVGAGAGGAVKSDTGADVSGEGIGDVTGATVVSADAGVVSFEKAHLQE